MPKPYKIFPTWLLISILTVYSATCDPIEFSETHVSSAQLDNPHDLKISPDGNHLYVSDVGNNRVAILDPTTLKFITAFGADHQSGTHDVDFDPQDRLYVADTHNNRVTIYDMDVKGNGISASLIDELSERIRGPEGVLFHPNGRVYVAGAWSNNVVSYENKKVVDELKNLSSPHDIELAPDGNIWLADAGNDRMLLLSPNLKILRELSGSPYDFDGVRYQDVMPDGTLIVADKYNHVVKIISPQGKLLKVLGTPKKAGKGPGQFRTPEGIEIKGRILWIADSGNNRIVRYMMNETQQ